MKFSKLLLCTAVLFCLAVHVYAQDEQSPAANTYSDPAVKEIKQYLDGPVLPDQSEKGKPPVGSPLAKPVAGQGQAASQNYLVKADLFLDGISTNNLYTMTVYDFINNSQVDSRWTILDIRTSEKYNAGHIENAMSIPSSDLVPMMNMIPADNKIVVYSDNDTNAAFGVMTLRVFGDRNAWMLQGGMPAWEAAGMPVV